MCIKRWYGNAHVGHGLLQRHGSRSGEHTWSPDVSVKADVAMEGAPK